MKVLVTGSNGFIGKNILFRLREHLDIEALTYVRGQDKADLIELLSSSNIVIHLAGENRPDNEQAFIDVNIALTEEICSCLKKLNKCIPILFASSAQAVLDNPYGRSKLAAEQAVIALAIEQGNPVAIYRLPGVFGKWCKPNFNSVVATFCYNKANDLPVFINDANSLLRLVYIDDVVSDMLSMLKCDWVGVLRPTIEPEYSVTLGELSDQIDAFKECRSTLQVERVGFGLTRALYSTYVSYLPQHKFVYDVPAYGDVRGVFVEMLKTRDSGQLSFFTAHPGITRGGHYHHTKTEKFLVIKGQARFGFRNLLNDEIYFLETCGDKPQIVDSVPGWTHDITNIGADELVVMLWVNEIFDRTKPDTIASKV
jgi:UDP-2-acetamido-2,6-beta-L-arabino-hexul-4-ose reductase